MASKESGSMKPHLAETVATRDHCELEAEQDHGLKEQQDVAVAALAIQTGVLSESQLSLAMTTWTIHGSVPLVEHLVTEGVIDEPTKVTLSQRGSERIESIRKSAVESTSVGGEGAIFTALDALDNSGTIARLLGIRATAGASARDSTGIRQAINRFRLVRKLGQGGLGRVWLAFDETLKRHVAVKEITVSDNEAVLERFRREAEITGRLEHPGIVPVYQLGEDTESGEVFYAMRFLGKKTMHDTIIEYHGRRAEGDEDPMLIRRLLTDFVFICQAIAHAHSRSVIHRDLKPENIGIDDFGQTIIIDWGLAKVIDDSGVPGSFANPSNALAGDQHSVGTMDGEVLGTPLYMAPEQAAGRIDELDARTDIYGLGAILFAILTGYAPHEKTRDASSATSARDLFTAITSQPTPDAHEINPSADTALSAICAKAMAHRQYARYQTASELAEDVQRWMAGEPVSAYREKTSRQIGRWIQRHRMWANLIAACLIVGVVAIATGAIASRQGQISARQVLFDEMGGYERELRVQLAATAAELEKDARFMSTLPPIQGIIDARSDSSPGSETEEVWQTRLGTIYEGLLRANPNYLAISYAFTSEENQGEDLVRVERNSSDGAYVQRVPASRLGPVADTELLRKTSALMPGAILLTIRRQDLSEISTEQSLRLVASTPIYDTATGSLFGIVSVETNLMKRLVNLVETIKQRDATIYITDSEGHVWISETPDSEVEIELGDISVTEVIPGTTDLFISRDQQRLLNRGAGWIASLMPLEPANPQTSVGVVIHLRDVE